MKRTRRTIALACGALLILAGGFAYSNRYALEHLVMSRMHDNSGQHSGGQHMGGQHMGGLGMGHMFKGIDTTEAEESELRTMFENHTGLNRQVENLPNGIRTITRAQDEDLRNAMIAHAAGMIARLDEGRDPKVFIQSPTLDLLFQNRALIATQIETTADGLIVTQTSEDAATVAALQTHAAEVSDLAARGMQSVHEAMQQRLN